MEDRTDHPLVTGAAGGASRSRTGSWSRWNDRSWPRRTGWTPPVVELIGRTTTAPERWPWPRPARVEPSRRMPPTASMASTGASRQRLTSSAATPPTRHR